MLCLVQIFFEISDTFRYFTSSTLQYLRFNGCHLNVQFSAIPLPGIFSLDLLIYSYSLLFSFFFSEKICLNFSEHVFEKNLKIFLKMYVRTRCSFSENFSVILKYLNNFQTFKTFYSILLVASNRCCPINRVNRPCTRDDESVAEVRTKSSIRV